MSVSAGVFVIEEQFELAKKIKQAMVDLQKVGERLGKYEVEKRRALEQEDFDLAQQKKQHMEEYRAHIQQQLQYHSLLDPHHPNTSAAVRNAAIMQFLHELRLLESFDKFVLNRTKSSCIVRTI